MPLAARAQQHTKPVIGIFACWLCWGTTRHLAEAFAQGLSQSGYVDGQNVTIEYRWADYKYDRLPALAAELVQRQVTMIAVGTPVATLAAKQATSSIPIIFHIGSDPVRDGTRRQPQSARREYHRGYLFQQFAGRPSVWDCYMN